MKKNLLYYGTTNAISDLLTREFNIIKNVEILYRNGDYTTNFDAVLNVDDCDSHRFQTIETFCKIKKIPHLGGQRYPKSMQHVILSANKIITPKTYYITSSKVSDFALVNLLLKIPDEQLVIAKYEYGARGVGQMLLTKKELINFALDGFSFIDESKSTNSEYNYSNSISGDTYNPPKDSNIKINSFSFIIPKIAQGEALIQEYVDVKREFRYLYFFGENPIIIERTKTQDEWQANSCITGNGRVLCGDEHMLFSQINPKIIALANYINAPFLSIDIYEDQHGNLGVFEFQMEFGIKYVPHIDLVNKISKSIKNKIK